MLDSCLLSNSSKERVFARIEIQEEFAEAAWSDARVPLSVEKGFDYQDFFQKLRHNLFSNIIIIM